MKNKITFIILLTLTVNSISTFSQLLETKHIIGITGGYGTLSGSGNNNMFFPDEVGLTGFNIDISYGHKMYSWLSGGAVLGYYQFSDPTLYTGFAQISSDGGKLISFGPQVNIHSPHKENGLLNSLRFGLAAAPQFHYYSGERMLLVDNEVIPLTEAEVIDAKFESTDSSSGFSYKLSPEINFRFSQRVGIKLAYHLQYSNIYTGYDSESTYLHSFMGGLIITLGNYRHIFM
ncbi:hypothetical protein [Carboxylicivirga linearis]|uniref:Outer membrane protein beta-barrel domain-containing protein n=1 Tax=Carboxylicivirga linearis TaxID=1628157 RepID=A0ABS5JTS9_9BACT|nr:hypothetical protein [Carboxylicivirga linearis]MBS2098280.1 hypothetical protein [Carboxylicivirga linearis]